MIGFLKNRKPVHPLFDEVGIRLGAERKNLDSNGCEKRAKLFEHGMEVIPGDDMR